MFCHFGETLARLRAERGLSRAALGKRADMSAAEIAEIEQAASLPTPRNIAAVASAVGMSTDELLLAAGVLPDWVEEALHSRPREALEALRQQEAGLERRHDDAAAIGEPAPPVVMQTPMGRLHQGDCAQLLGSLQDESVDLVFADPPFNLSKDYGTKVDDKRPEVAYFEWSQTWMREAVRVLKPGASLFLYNIPRWNVHLAAWLATRLEFRHWITVDIKFSLPIAGRLYPSHYSLLYFCKGRKPKTFKPPRLPIETCRHCGGEIRDYGGYKDRMNPKGVNLTDVWTDISPVRHARFKRRQANELPVKMLDRVLDIASAEGDVVVDPFGGSGTTFVAAELKGRRWIGCELGDCGPILERFAHLDRERKILAEVRENINVLFTPASLALRRRNGRDTSRYRFEDDADDGLAEVHEPSLFDYEG
jgi:site-specific DNA-methyltransferase (adenine-specific)